MIREDVWMLVSLVGPAWTLLDGLGELLLYCTVVHFRSDDA
jgi:hypothetical protein